MAFLVTALSPGAVAWADHGPDDSRGSENFEFLGELDHSKGQTVKIGAIDVPNRRLYGGYQLSPSEGRIVEYDLSTEVPVPLRNQALNLPALQGQAMDNMVPYLTAVDSEGRRLFVGAGNAGERILVIDTETLRYETQYLTQATLPGFSTMGLTYSEADNRLYLVGTFRTNAFVGVLAGLAGYPAGTTAVAALEADTGDVAWLRPVPECRMKPLNQQGSYGAPLFRSELRSALYFFCASGLGSQSTQAGQSGVVRLSIDGDAGQADAASFGADFFPVSGTYYTRALSGRGIAGFDPATDRLFVQSLSTSVPGTWVFDGRLESYVGFVGAPNDTNVLVAVNRRTGRYYMGMTGKQDSNDDAGIVVVDGRATPVPQGAFDRDMHPGTNPMFVDPPTDRLFLQDNPDGTRRVRVLRDLSEPPEPDVPRDPDALTADIPEGPDTTANFTGIADGFGAGVTLVGGFESAVTSARSLNRSSGTLGDVAESAPVDLGNPLEFTFGDRGVLAGRTVDVTLSGFGATAGAQALAPDGATEADREKRRQQIFGEDDPPDEGPDDGGDESDSDDGECDPADDPSCVLESPYPQLECSDGGEGRSQHSHTSDDGFREAEVVCDLAAEQASATARYRAEPVGTGISVSSSSFDTDLRRDDEFGTVIETVARSEGLRLPVGEDGATLEIGSVTARAETVAHGRTGTSGARWVRTMDGVRIVDADGTTNYPREGEGDPTSCVTVITGGSGDDVQRTGSCQALVDGLNEILPDDKMKLRLPTPEVTASPKGALGQVWESDRDFLRGRTLYNDADRDVPALEAVVYKEAQERSRVLVELASLQSTSIYTITKFESFSSGPALDFDGPGSSVPDGELSPPGLNVPELGADVGTDEQLVSQLSSFLSNVDPSQLVDPPSVDPPLVASEPSGGSDMPADTGGVSSLPGMSTATAPEFGDDVDSGEPAPQVAAPADQPADTQGDDQAQASGSTGTKMLARSAADAALVGGIWLLFLGAIVVVMRRASLLQLLRP